MKKRPSILTIAGFDPSNGAGLTADIKTFEALKCYGLSVCTANTIQNDIEFKACHWTEIILILNQMEILFNRFEINYVKIGIVENWEILSIIINRLQELNPEIKIVLDPVLKSSSDFSFHSNNSEKLDDILSKIYLLTPNYNEIQQLYPEKDIEETIAYISSKTNLFLKGGHRTDKIGRDVLYITNKKQFTLNPKSFNCSEKHGSGCVLSSAITSYLALGFPLLKACKEGKRYTEKFLNSNKSMLGFHSKK
ncbi:hydroxymethylpyrimidine/phosphomethylpyrimidine kinase [Algibacter sp. L4_22]|uniref:hydroxymethylpyrimidine/phosphomethylpyrimidine kinase n=1 Tax=Algibacter sp. L4_22 TaxID=2942477 RepID=UPI00201B94CA|nr:hydroxymethylpyrimidine/phosphomethylpyrimidine kinase [Algibacter sp. L4_22]MCL5128349.1 hydroxymethylpyrimidine/phosphomethylpyrimidine kinase [Algibacter sp. L4_22]